jgi:hypothetical protein
MPSGTEVCRPFLPTKDLGRSCAFYEALGFKKVFQGDVAIFAVGATSFILRTNWAGPRATTCGSISGGLRLMLTEFANMRRN